jgi:hypothetical protein
MKVGQIEWADLCCDIRCFRFFWFVGYNGFVEIGTGSDWVLIGQTTSHPSNHWGTQSTIDNMKLMAGDYHTQYGGTYPVIAINDISLEYGAVFDLNQDWVPPHSNHGQGKAVDIRGNEEANSIPRVADVQNAFMEMCQDRGATLVLHESVDTGNEHFHCQWP